MKLFEIGFVTVRLVDVLDIGIVTFLFYKLYENIRGRLAIRIISLIIALFFIWKIVDLLGFRLLGSIMGEFLGLGAIAVVILFAPEIRNFLSAIIKNPLLERLIRTANGRDELNQTSAAIIEALKSLRATGNGALIVITGENPLFDIQSTGDPINSDVQSRLIFTIFQKESPLHDGAMIIHQGRIAAVRAILPISKSNRLDPELGLRHRAALGMAENSDALVIVVSEERRELSIALRGELHRRVDYNDIDQALAVHFS